MNELYSTSDSFYCVAPPSGCSCYLSHNAGTSPRSYYSTSPTIYNVQDCTAYLAAAYANYGVSFDDINEIIEYLDYFGEIEDEYNCSGICSMLNVYYFSNSNNGQPEKKCQAAITDDILTDQVQAMGIGYFITGCIAFIVLFIQYGLCCRKNRTGGDTRKF